MFYARLSSELFLKPVFFSTPQESRAWLSKQHDKTAEVWVGFHKKSSGEPSITWPEAVREALCYGWIDGIRRTIDDADYMIRFTARKERSTWSLININMANELIQQELMQPAGLKAFRNREEKIGTVLLRAKEDCQVRPCLRSTIQKKPEGMGLLSVQTSLISTNRDLVGNGCETGRNQATSNCQTYR